MTEGHPARVEPLDDESVAALLPERDVRAHKGTHGTLLVVAGSLDHLGAALLATRAATRAGAGLVALAVPRSLQPLVAGRVMEVVTMGLPEDRHGDVEPQAAAEELLSRPHDALLVGPGLSPSAGASELVRALLTAPRPRRDADGPPPSPAVVDAQALNVLAATELWWDRATRPCVLTPHPGEFRRLDGSVVTADDDERCARTIAAAARWRQVVVLKGARTVVAGPRGDAARAPFENPALATAGTGDVLTGTIGALLAQGLDPYAAARLGVYLHGAAGERVRDRLGDSGLVASDLPLEIAAVRRRLDEIRRRGGGGRLGFVRREPPRP